MKSRVGRRQGITKIRKKQIRDLKRQKKRSMKLRPGSLKIQTKLINL